MAKRIPSPQSILMWLLFEEKSEQIATSRMTNRKGAVGVHSVTGKYDPTSMVSSIVANAPFSDIYNNFFNLENYKLSSLVPEMRLYKSAVGGRVQPFYFPEHAVDPGIGSTGWSTFGVGIKSFDVKFSGTDPFTAKRYLECNLQIYVDSLENIFRTPPSENYAVLADLFTISTKYKNKRSKTGGFHGADTFTNPNFEVIATLGYATPTAGVFTSEEISDIRNNVMTLRMTINDHTINVNQDGTATIDITYIARLGRILDNGIYNLFNTPEDISKVFLNNIRANAQARANIFGGKEKKALKDLEEELKIKNELEKTSRVRQILEKEFVGRPRRVKPAVSQITRFKEDISSDEEAPAPPPTQAPAAAPGSIKKPTAKTAQVDELMNLSNAGIQYYPLADIMRSYFKVVTFELGKVKASLTQAAKNPPAGEKAQIEGKLKIVTEALEKLKNIRVLLADVRIKGRRYNLGDLPVTIDLWKRIVSLSLIKNISNMFTPTKFLSIVVRELLPAVLKSPYDIKLRMSQIDGPKLRSKLKKRSSIPAEEIESTLGMRSINGILDGELFFVISQEMDRDPASGAPAGTGRAQEDAQRGVFHLRIGQNRGLVKSISFQKFDSPFKREALMTNSVSLYDELKMPYSANVDMFGNSLFLPGSQLFIDPQSMGFGNINEPDSPSNRLGLGGYYTVLSVNTSYDGVSLNTSLECSFGSFIPDKTKNSSLAAIRSARNALAEAQNTEEEKEPAPVPEPPPNTGTLPPQPASPSADLDGLRATRNQMRSTGITDEHVSIVNSIERDLRTNPTKKKQVIDSDAHKGKNTTVKWSQDAVTKERRYLVTHSDGSVYVLRVNNDGTSNIVKKVQQ